MAFYTFRDGRRALFDDQDNELVAAIAWCPTLPASKVGHCYATGWIPKLKRTGYMHRLILDASAGQLVDHVNGDTLDNRRCNLRLCNGVQNNGNSRHPLGASGFRGVCFDKRRGVFFARIAMDSREVRLGTFRDPIEAARRYDEAARGRFGEFATLNFPLKAV